MKFFPTHDVSTIVLKLDGDEGSCLAREALRYEFDFCNLQAYGTVEVWHRGVQT